MAEPVADEELDLATCRALLRSTRVGRIAVNTRGWPVLRPVAYGYDEADQAIVFRTGRGSKLAALLQTETVAFEIDGLDPATGHAWSVIAQGRAEEVVRAGDVRRFETLGVPQWTSGPTPHWIRLRPQLLTGRRLVVDAATEPTTDLEVTMERIVVGVDGSENSLAALRWAIAQAARQGARVEAVLAWHDPYVAGSLPAPPIDHELLEKSYRQELDRIIDSVDASALTEGIEPILVNGAASYALVDAGKGADLLVVGARGHGGLLGLMMGSVAHRVAAHAPCPVVVVPAPETGDEAGAAA